MYGSQWVSVFGEVDGPAFSGWSAMLESITELELAGALKLCETRTGTFPPGFPEFRSMCMAARANMQPNVTETRIRHENDKGLPMAMLDHLTRSATSTGALRELDRMRRLLAGEEVESFEQSFHNCGLGRRWPTPSPPKNRKVAAWSPPIAS